MSAIIFLCVVFVIVIMPYIVHPKRSSQVDDSDAIIAPEGYPPTGRARKRAGSNLKNS